jgi:hypothetical protein
VVGGEVRAAGTVALVGEVGVGLLRASDPLGSARGVPAEVLRGLRRSGNHQRQGIEAAELLTGCGPRCDSSSCMGSGREGRAWEASWRQGGADAGLGRGWGAAEQPDHGGAESSVRRSKAAGC